MKKEKVISIGSCVSYDNIMSVIGDEMCEGEVVSIKRQPHPYRCDNKLFKWYRVQPIDLSLPTFVVLDSKKLTLI